jgi:hypothetical protein
MAAEAIVCGYGGSSVLAAGCAAVVQGGRECGEHKQQYCLDVHNWFENQLLHGRLWSRCRNADLSRSTWNGIRVYRRFSKVNCFCREIELSI